MYVVKAVKDDKQEGDSGIERTTCDCTEYAPRAKST